MLKYTLLLILLMFTSNSCAKELYAFKNEYNQKRFQYLSWHIRCLECSDEPIAEAQTPWALMVREKIYQFIVEGKSDTEIESYLVKRYGQTVLYLPKQKNLRDTLWIAPTIFFVSGMLLFLRLRKNGNKYIRPSK